MLVWIGFSLPFASVRLILLVLNFILMSFWLDFLVREAERQSTVLLTVIFEKEAIICDKMILCLAATDAPIFSTPRKAFYWLNQRPKIFCAIRNFLPANILETFSLILLHLLIQVLTLEIRRFKPLQYTCKCKNWFKVWKSTKLGIFLIL